MNWKKIDESWELFASQNNVSLVKSDENLFHGVLTKYELSFPGSDQEVSLQGKMWKDFSGVPRNQTSLRIKNVDLAFDKISDRRLFWIFKINYADKTKSELLGLLRKYEAKELKKTDDGLSIRFDFIFEDLSHFGMALDLIDKIVTILRGKTESSVTQ